MMDKLPPPAFRAKPVTMLFLLVMTAVVTACNPTVKIEAPDRPIEINLNIKIEQEVRIKVERDLEKVFADDPAIFGIPGGGAGK